MKISERQDDIVIGSREELTQPQLTPRNGYVIVWHMSSHDSWFINLKELVGNRLSIPFRQTARHRRRRAATARRERIWDFGVIPYEIDGNFSGAHKTLFKQVFQTSFLIVDTHSHPRPSSCNLQNTFSENPFPSNFLIKGNSTLGEQHLHQICGEDRGSSQLHRFYRKGISKFKFFQFLNQFILRVFL